MELYNDPTTLPIAEQTAEEEVLIPASAEGGPDTEIPTPLPASLLDDSPDGPSSAPPAVAEEPAPSRSRRRTSTASSILTIASRGSVESEDAREAAAWHEIHNAYRTRKILSGHLGGIEQTEGGKTIATVEYNGFRIAIPLKEMMIQLENSTAQSTSARTLRQNKLLGNMLGAEIDFVVRGIDSGSRSVVASRRDAMLRKRQLFYLTPGPGGCPRIEPNSIVQARVIAVAEKTVRVEVFGVETSILARDLAWDWIGDAHDRFAVGDEVLVRVQEVRGDTPETLSVRADIKSTTPNTCAENLKKCRVQSRYAGRVTDVHRGIVYVRLANGVNAVAHSCYDHRMPGKKDDVSFVVTKLDTEHSIAVGIITRIIRQNL